MIKEFLKRRREKKEQDAWERSFLGKTLDMHTKEYFDKYPRLSDLSADSKASIIGNFYANVFESLESENCVNSLREKMASYIVSFSDLQVLCLTEDEMRDSDYADCPFISGELYHHISDASDHLAELKELKWKYGDIDDRELISFCNSRCVVLLYYINGLNYVRCESGDFDSTKDWLKPFMKSMLIVSEDNIRSKIGLKSLLNDSLDNLKHSSFLNIVLNGSRNPYFEWDTKWGNSL